MFPWLEENTGFLGSNSCYEEATAVLIGIPMDMTVSFKPGSRLAPASIRSQSLVLEEYSPYFRRSLSGLPFWDGGDLILPYGNLEESLQRIKKIAGVFWEEGKFPFFIGGEHLITYPLVDAAFTQYPNLKVIQFDAHADLREDYLGERLSHATVMRLVSEKIGSGNLYQLGIRSGIEEEFIYASHTKMFFGEVLEPLERIKSELREYPVYVTIDIDVVDPAFAPGTGTPEPGGCTAQELLAAVGKLHGLNIIGCDLVEVAPSYDHAAITSVLAAKLIREALLGFVDF